MNYYNYFISFWLPILKRQIFKARLNNDTSVLICIKENIWKNWNFTKNERDSILKELNLIKIS